MRSSHPRLRRLLAVPILLLLGVSCQDAGRITQPDESRRPNFNVMAGGPFAYVVNQSSDEVKVINTATNTVVATVAVGDRPSDLAITPDGAFAYVASINADNVSVISTATNTVVATVAPLGSSPNSVAITPDGALAYVTNFNSGDVSVINTATNTVAATVAVGMDPAGLAITPDGAFVYVANNGDDNVSVISTLTNTVVATVAVGNAPQDVATTPDGAFAYVTNFLDGSVSVIDVATNTVSTTVALPGGSARSVTITPDGAFAYVAIGSRVVVISTLTNNVVATTVTLGCAPWGVAITPDGAFAYVTLFCAADVLVISTATNTVAATITVGAPPNVGVAITPVTPGPIDEEGPEATAVAANPNPVAVGANVDLTANVDDANTGGSDIASAAYNVDAGSFSAMSAADGIFDAVSENVMADISALAAATGVFILCVQGTDAPGNVGAEACTMLAVYDPEGGFVTGGGWINSPAGAYIPDPSLTGKANFGFVSKYKKGATVPTGNTEFRFQAGDLNFHSTSYDFLVITMGGTNAQFKGSGTINGGLAPNGTEFKFMIWAQDDSPDTFRIKIWWEDASGVESDVYDNGLSQAISGGSIMIHTD